MAAQKLPTRPPFVPGRSESFFAIFRSSTGCRKKNRNSRRPGHLPKNGLFGTTYWNWSTIGPQLEHFCVWVGAKAAFWETSKYGIAVDQRRVPALHRTCNHHTQIRKHSVCIHFRWCAGTRRVTGTRPEWSTGLCDQIALVLFYRKITATDADADFSLPNASYHALRCRADYGKGDVPLTVRD